MRKELRARTKPVAETAWRDELRGRVDTRLQTRALLDTSRVATSDSNVTLKSATVGRVGSVPASVVAPATEFGVGRDKVIASKSKRGKPYKRRMGGAFGPPSRSGKVVLPAFRSAVPRVGALWIQTAIRTFAEAVEKVAK